MIIEIVYLILIGILCVWISFFRQPRRGTTALVKNQELFAINSIDDNMDMSNCITSFSYGDTVVEGTSLPPIRHENSICAYFHYLCIFVVVAIGILSHMGLIQ